MLEYLGKPRGSRYQARQPEREGIWHRAMGFQTQCTKGTRRVFVGGPRNEASHVAFGMQQPRA